MDWHAHIVAELHRRADLLPAELQEWQARTDANKDGMGIHQRQIDAITLMFEELIAMQTDLMADLDAAQSLSDLAG